VELWRPRRDPKQRARATLAGVMVFTVLIASLVAAVMLRRPLVLALGLAAALGLACALWLRGGGAIWDATRPRPWVPRVLGDRRGARGPDRRAAERARLAQPSGTPAPCISQPAPRRVAIGGRPPV
jgi:hypothetical protein